MDRRTLVFVTKAGCGLCDEALPVLRRAARWLRVVVDVVDITSDSDLEARYYLRIPVVIDRRGNVVAEGVIGARDALLAVLKAYR